MDKIENVFIVLCDTLRAKSLPHYGNERNTVPNLSQAIDRDFVVFERAYASASWTIPSHLSLFTGLYPSQVMESPTMLELNSNLMTLAGLFKDSGYKTVGISANALISKKFNFHRDFDLFLQGWLPDLYDTDIFLSSKESNKFKKLYKELSAPGGLKKIYNYNRQTAYKKRHDIIQDATDSTYRIFSNLKKMISDSNTGNEFYFINLMQTHEKYNPPGQTRNTFVKNNAEFDKYYKERTAQDHYAIQPFNEELLRYLELRYEEEIVYLDMVIADFIKYLKAKKLYDSSTIILTSDHGEHFGENGHFSHWFSVFEPVIKIPMYIKWPGKSENGDKHRNEMVMLHDLYATFANILDHWQPCPESSIDLNSVDKRSVILSQLPDAAYPVEGCRKKKDDFSLDDVGLNEGSLNAYIFENGIKIIENGNKVVEYNLDKDPEENDPYDTNKEVLQTIKSKILG